MKKAIFLWIALLSVRVEAGEIFGTMTADGVSVGAGVTVEIAAPSKTYVVQTDAEGVYRVYVKEAGKFILTVRHHDASPTMEVTSQEEKSSRYDLLLTKKEGTYGVRRK